MKVGLVCPYDMGSPGGVQQLVSELAGHLRAVGDEVVIVGAGGTGFSGEPGQEDGTVTVGRPTRVRGNKSTVPLTIQPGSWRRVRHALADVDVVNVHEPLIPLVGWAALTVDRPLVASFHADAPGWARVVYRWAPLVGVFGRATLTAASPTAANAIPARWGSVDVIPNAIDVDSFDIPVDRVPGRVAFLGRDEPRKGLNVLLQAWPEIQRSRPNAELVVMGADRGVPPPGVTYLGPVSAEEKRRVLASSAIYVAPNTGGESFGIVVAEGMAAGCAVVASDLDSFRPVLGDAGHFFPAGDSHALATVVSELLGDRPKAERLGDAARTRARLFDWSEVVGLYRQAYSEALR